MWRQVKLTCLQGRNLGASRPLPEDFSNTDPDALPLILADVVDHLLAELSLSSKHVMESLLRVLRGRNA